MCVGIIGGMDESGKHCAQEAKRRGIILKGFSRPETAMAARIRDEEIPECERLQFSGGEARGGQNHPSVGECPKRPINIKCSWSSRICSR